MRAAAIGRVAGFALIVAGVLMLGCAVFNHARANWAQHTALEALKEASGTAVSLGDTTLPPRLEAGAPLGTLEIPRLNLATVVFEGEDEPTLAKGVGHLWDTSLPWQGGNTALAAHRDSFFRPLEHIRIGDAMRLVTPQGNYDYVVRETFVVDPTDLWVLDPTPQPTLTLITCYPFNYIGPAPRRFIVRAERIQEPRSPSA